MSTATLQPADLGLPTKFDSFRVGQESCALELASSRRRFSLLSAPTGTGKSLIYNAAAKLLGARALVLVGTKGLQAQLMADFAAIGMVDVRGQSNYRCVAVDRFLHDFGAPGTTCDDGPCHVGVYCSLKDEGGCLYYDAQKRAREADLVVTNYAYWMTLGRHSDPSALGEFDLLILDEAHSAPDWLADFCAVELNRHEVKSLLGLELPPVDEGVAVWAEWARGAAEIAKAAAVSTRAALMEAGDRKVATKQLLRLSDLQRGLSELATAGKWKSAEGPRRDARMPGLHTDWVAEKVERGVRFSPVWAHAYAEPYLFRGIPRVLLASATLSPSVKRYLGIGPDSDYYEVPSGFSPERRPLIYVPTTRVDRNMTEGQVRLWVNRIDAIIERRRDRKGIIHTRSYSRAKQLLERSRYSSLMLSHDTRTTRDVVARFKRAAAPCVLVSPSVEEGFDFPGHECAYQIIAKVPFIDGRSPVAKARSRSDKGYANYVAALSLVQMVGRGMRSAEDACETFILDDHWAWFRRAAQFPRWFKAAWVQAVRVPDPMPLSWVKHAAQEQTTDRVPASGRRSVGGHRR